MKNFFIVCSFVSLSSALYAQVPEDALKFSWQPVRGTARIAAVGGAMGSLGGDISALFVNPAGLAFYRTTDFVLTPGYSFLKNKNNFRGTGTKDDKESHFSFGASGVVGGWQTGRKWGTQSVSLGVTQTANFNNNIFYTGQNDFSSLGEQFAAEAAYSRLSIDDILNSNSVSLGTRMALYGYFVDTTRLGSNTTPDFVSLAMYDQLKNGGDFLLNQQHRIETSGGITEIALGYAASMDDKVYIGGSIGIPIISYKKTSIVREEDATGDNANYFDFAELYESFATKGAGLNAKLGVIIKPAEFVRLGLAIHSPTFYDLKDTYSGQLSVNTENYRTVPGTQIVSSDVFTGGERALYKYNLITPWRFMLSGSYVLREIADVKKQKGFLTADVEYVSYRSNRYRDPEDEGSSYYDGVNTAIKDYYKNAFNFRVGGELKFTILMARLGFSYYGNPYKDKELKANKLFLSGGLGYRNKGMFVDVTYIHGLQKDVNFPYRLPDKANTFANTKTNGGNVMLTVGFKI